MRDLDFIETCYEAHPDDALWGISLAECLARVMPDSQGILSGPYEVNTEGGHLLRLVGDDLFMSDPMYEVCARNCIRAMSTSPIRAMLLENTYAAGTPTVVTLSELPAHQQFPVRDHIPWRDGDCTAFFATLDCRHGYKLATVAPGSLGNSRCRRAQLARLCEHIAVGYWLRSLRPSAHRATHGDVDAVFAPDGKRLDHAGWPGALDDDARLVDAVRGMDRSRCRRQKRSSGEATELWQALVAGRYALVESFDRGGRRVILAVRCRAGRPALTPRELAVASAAARGLPNKLIAAELGITASTVAVHLGAALRKLGCRNRRELPRWLSAGPETAS